MNLPGCCPRCGNVLHFEWSAGSITQFCPVCIAERTHTTSSGTSDPNMLSIEPYLREQAGRVIDPMDELRADNARLQAELSALRADIEAGRLVRVSEDTCPERYVLNELRTACAAEEGEWDG